VIFTLDGDDKILLGVGYLWQQAEGIWRPQSANEYIYNSTGLEIERILSSWSSSMDTLVPLIKWEREYDFLNRLVAEELFYSFGIEDYWEEDNIKLFEYDSENNLVETIFQYWESGEYVSQSKVVSAFDLTYLSINIMEPILREWSNSWIEDHNNKILSSTIFSFSENGWVETADVLYFYTELGTTPVMNASSNPIVVYPNPFRETIRFGNSEGSMDLTLFDLQGRVVLQKKIFGEAVVPLEELPAGVYLYQLLGTNFKQNGKLLKE
jgi:hypothetical protein